MLRQRSLRSLFVGLQAAALLGLGLLYGCGQDNSTGLSPERAGGPLASRHALPPLGPLPDAPSPGPSPSPVTLPPGFWNAVVDLDGDGLRDVLVAQATQNKVRIYRGIDQNEFTEIHSVPVVNPRDLAVGDVNGDGIPDLAVYSPGGRTVSIFVNSGVDDFALAAVRNLPADTQGIIVGDYDADGKGDIYFGTSNPDLVWIVRDADNNFDVTKLTTRAFGPAPEVAATDCGNEPDCSPHAEYEGIQECLRAADCRAEKCAWAACVLYKQHWWQAPRYAGAMLACAAVHITESALCLPTSLIPKGKLSSGLPQKTYTLTATAGVSLFRQLDDAGHATAKLNYYVQGGEVRVDIVNLMDGTTTWDTTCVVGAYSSALRIVDDGQFLEMRDASGKPYGLTLEEQAELGAAALIGVRPADPPTKKGIGPFVIPLGKCCLVIGWSPEEHKNCLVTVFACDRDRDGTPDSCRMLVICPFGGRSGYYDCMGSFQKN